MSEQIGTGSKKVRGRAQKSIELIDAMHSVAEAAQPINGRGIGYKLFTMGLIASMARSEMQCVYRLLKEAREEGIIPWDWIVDETRELEKVATWKDPAQFVRCVRRSYRRDFWDQQSVRVEVWSEKGTIRGVLAPVLDEYGVGFRVMHGFSSATTVNEIARDGDGRPLIALYAGDYDPSGMWMSEKDLPERIERYGGTHVILNRIVLKREHVLNLPWFDAEEKEDDTRYKWFVKEYGDRCWELDAMDPNDLRACVEEAILAEIEPKAWKRCEKINKAETESLRTVLDSWKGSAS